MRPKDIIFTTILGVGVLLIGTSSYDGFYTIAGLILISMGWIGLLKT